MSAPLTAQPGEQDTFYIECRDTFGVKNATLVSGDYTKYGQTKPYVASCTYQGKQLPWKVLDVYHAGLSEASNWSRFREGMIKRARKDGCKYVAVRTFPPTMSMTDEAVAGLCVQP